MRLSASVKDLFSCSTRLQGLKKAKLETDATGEEKSRSLDSQLRNENPTDGEVAAALITNEENDELQVNVGEQASGASAKTAFPDLRLISRCAEMDC